MTKTLRNQALYIVLGCSWPEVEINIIPPVEIRSKCQTISSIKGSAGLFYLCEGEQHLVSE